MHQTIKTIAYMVAMAIPVVQPNGLETGPKVACPPDFISLGESCYFFSDTLATYYEARNLCREMAPGESGQSNLAVLGADYEEYRHVTGHMILNYSGAMWVGLSDEMNEGDWVWLDGSGLSKASSMWACTEPESSTLYNCAPLILVPYTASSRIVLSAESCTDQGRYICEYS